jgi:hypothetical protein
MHRSYADFCVNKDTVLTNHPHLKDIRFCLIKVSNSGDRERIIPFLAEAGFKWLFRTGSNDALNNSVLERVYADRTVAKHKDTIIIRPLTNRPIVTPRGAWLELTPSILQSSVRTRRDHGLFIRTVEQAGVERVVLSSDKPNPPSMRDMVSLMAILLELKFEQLDALIKHNNRRLESELL